MAEMQVLQLGDIRKETPDPTFVLEVGEGRKVHFQNIEHTSWNSRIGEGGTLAEMMAEFLVTVIEDEEEWAVMDELDLTLDEMSTLLEKYTRHYELRPDTLGPLTARRKANRAERRSGGR